MFRFSAAYTITIVCSLGACARVDVRPVSTDEFVSSKTVGMRCFMPQPYLLVTVAVDKDNNTQYKTDLISLPDVEHPMVADVKPGWGTVKGTLAINGQGILTNVGSELDSKIPETINAISGLLTAAKPLLVPTATVKPKAYLLKINMDKGVLKLGDPVEIKLPS